MDNSKKNMNIPNTTSVSTPSDAPDAEQGYIYLYGIARDSIVDGPGLRYAVFTQGCRHACPKCHNADSWKFNGGIRKDINTIIDEIRDDKLCTGLSISGGDPFSRMSEVLELIEAVRREFGNSFSVWIWSGFTFEELRENTEAMEILEKCDVLVDGPYIDERHHEALMWRGSSNQRVIDLRATLSTGAVTLYCDSSFEEKTTRRVGHHPPVCASS